MKLLSACIAGLCCLGASVAVAQDIPGMSTDRPDETESSSVVPVGIVQIEAGIGYQKHKTDPDGELRVHRSMALPSVLLREGTLEWLELRASAELTMHMQDYSGVRSNAFRADWGVGAKIQMFEESGLMPEMAFIGELNLPSGKSVSPGFRLAMSHTLSPAIGFGYNIGAEIDTDMPSLSESFTWLYTAALGADLTESLGGFIEVFGSHGGGAWEHLADGGFTYMLGQNTQLDAAVGAGISGGAPDYYVNAGISVRFQK